MVAFRAPAVELTTPSLTFQRATFYIELNNLAVTPLLALRLLLPSPQTRLPNNF
jgi:hypothetical protein